MTDWGRIQVHIACRLPEGQQAWLVRMPCFLSTAPDPRDPSRAVLAFREKIHGRAVMVACDPENIQYYGAFVARALDAARQDRSLLVPSGRLYAVVVGAFVTAGSGSLVVRTDVPGGGYTLDYAYGWQDGS